MRVLITGSSGLIGLVLLTLTATQSLAQGPPPEVMAAWPTKYIGTLYLEFCEVGHHVCTEIAPQVWGQLCFSEQAAEEGKRVLLGVNDPESLTYEGDIMPHAHYAGWRCEGNEFAGKDIHWMGQDARFSNR